MPLDDVGKQAQQLVALGKAALDVVVLHADEVRKDDRRGFAAIQQLPSLLLGELKKVGHAGKPRQVIEVVRLDDAVLEQCAAENGGKILVGALVLGGIGALVGIPHIGKAGAVALIDMPAHRVDDFILRAVRGHGTVEHLVVAALIGKAERLLGDARLVLRVGHYVHILFQNAVGVRLVVYAEQLAHAVRDQQRLHFFVNQLIYGERYAEFFQRRCLNGVKLVFFHTNPPLCQ